MKVAKILVFDIIFTSLKNFKKNQRFKNYDLCLDGSVYKDLCFFENHKFFLVFLYIGYMCRR